MGDVAELEIGLRRTDSDAYLIEWRYSQPLSEAGPQLASWRARFDLSKLRALTTDDLAYGRLLGQSLFADPNVRGAFMQARRNAQALDAALRLRLFIDASASELNALRWETLCDPQDDARLFTGERILFSRYLNSDDMRPVRLRPQSALRALVIIASPSDVGEYKLAALDVAAELARAKISLGNVSVSALASNGTATLNNLADKLRDDYDIVYVVAHGALIHGEAYLWLEEAAGKADVVKGTEIVARFGELRQGPRLAVLASCQSGAQTSDGAHAALGPLLAAAGVPAVVAMQGNITLQTADVFMPMLFKELRRDGQIDRAVAVARGAVREQPDSWMPVLFMRLRGGNLWHSSSEHAAAGQMGGVNGKDTKVDAAINKTTLRKVLVDRFTEEELELLCADVQQMLSNDAITLQVNLEMIGGSGKSGKVLKLIDYLDRRGYLDYLLRAVRETRPGII
jgi:hypothetical protein